MRRLSITVFLAVLGSLFVFALAVMGAWRWGIESRAADFERQLSTELAEGAIPDAARGRAELQRALDRWHDRAKIDLALFDADGRLLARAGRPIQRPGEPGPGRGPSRADADRGRDDARNDGPRRRWVATVDLSGGRTLLVRPAHDRAPRSPVGLVAGLGLLLAAVALVAWPVSRRITRRLERLQKGVDRLGSGDLGARVAVEGKDEVAALARSFNVSAGRIEDLMNAKSRLLDAQRKLLANASHELRSPLARMRMGLALMDDESAGGDGLQGGAAVGGALALGLPGLSTRVNSGARAEIERNIAELDELVDEILTASRLDTAEQAIEFALEPVDLAGIAAEEAARVGAEVEVLAPAAAPNVAIAAVTTAATLPGRLDATAIELRGDPRLLRRLVRNLLENALRHHRRAGDASETGEAVRVLLSRDANAVRLEVLDRGPGVAPAERERIFEAFYRPDGHSEKSGGVGLGLSLARQIARAHGGTVECFGRDGGGARFVVELPNT